MRKKPANLLFFTELESRSTYDVSNDRLIKRTGCCDAEILSDVFHRFGVPVSFGFCSEPAFFPDIWPLYEGGYAGKISAFIIDAQKMDPVLLWRGLRSNSWCVGGKKKLPEGRYAQTPILVLREGIPQPFPDEMARDKAFLCFESPLRPLPEKGRPWDDETRRFVWEIKKFLALKKVPPENAEKAQQRVVQRLIPEEKTGRVDRTGRFCSEGDASFSYFWDGKKTGPVFGL